MGANYISSPAFATDAVSITASDTINNTTKLKASVLFIGSGGDVTVIIAGARGSSGGFPTSGRAVTFKNLSSGCFLPVMVDYVLATGTTAADIIALK